MWNDFSQTPSFFSITFAEAILGSLQVISMSDKPHLVTSINVSLRISEAWPFGMDEKYIDAGY